MTKEANLWKWLKGVRKKLPKTTVHIIRIENGVEEGTPDVNLCVNGLDFWIELKTADRPVRHTTPIDFGVRTGQTAWHRRRQRVKGSTWCLLQVGSGQGRTLYLISGSLIKEVDIGLTEVELTLKSTLVLRGPANPVLLIEKLAGFSMEK